MPRAHKLVIMPLVFMVVIANIDLTTVDTKKSMRYKIISYFGLSFDIKMLT